jgi:hypothetical protein
MTEQQTLDAEIASVEASIAENTVKLKAAQARWEDYQARRVRAAIGQDQVQLHHLKIRRARLSSPQEKRSPAVFYGSNE